MKKNKCGKNDTLYVLDMIYKNGIVPMVCASVVCKCM